MQMANEVHWPIPDSITARLPSAALPQNLTPRGASVPFAGKYFAVDWLKRAAEVHERDKIAEHKKKLYVVLIALSFGLGLLVTCAAAQSNDGTAAFITGAIGLVAGVFFIVKWRGYDVQDIEDYRLEVFAGTLVTLAPELNPKRPVDARVDFTAYTKHPVPNAGGEQFSQRWLELHLPLRDGCWASLMVTISVKQKSKRKRRYTKIKRRTAEMVTVRISPPPGKSFNPASNATAPRGRSIPGFTLNQVSIQPNWALFQWARPVTRAVCDRAGWPKMTELPLESKNVVAALVASYQLAARGERHAA
jgi:hypothetical protein